MAFIFPLIGVIASVAGTVVGMAGQMQQANAAKQAADFRAKQEAQAAQTARAEGQRMALEKHREGQLAQSRQIAVAAASGGGATDPTVLALGENIAGREKYLADMETYKGENRARGLMDQAAADRSIGAAAASSGQTMAAATGLSGFGRAIGSVGSIIGGGSGANSAYGRYNNYGYG